MRYLRNSISIGLRQACRRQRELLHERADRPQLVLDGSRDEILDQAVNHLRSDAKQLSSGAMPAITILTGIERRYVGADQLPRGRRKRGRTTQDRLGSLDPMRVDFRMRGEHLFGGRIFGQ